MTTPEPRSLADLAAESGVPVPCAGNLPLNLDDPQFVWFVDKGAVDLFLVEHRDGVEQLSQQHLLRADSGRLLPTVRAQGGHTTFKLIAKGLPGTVLRRLPFTSLATVRNAELAEHVDAWLMDVSTMLSRDVLPWPRPDVLVESGEAPATRNGTLSAKQGVVWTSGLTAGTGLFMSLIEPAESKGGAAAAVIPLTPVSWLTLMEPVQLSTWSSKTLAEERLLLPALAHFNATADSLAQLNRRMVVVDQANLDRTRAINRRNEEEGARHRLFNLYGLLEQDTARISDSGLSEVLEMIGRHEGINFKWPVKTDSSDANAVIRDVLDASGVRGRRVRLDQKDRWWIGDSGAMLAFRADDGRPVALLPGRLGHYREVDPVTRRKSRVTAERAESLRAEAWLFYPPLPASSAGPRDLFRLAGKGLTGDFVRFVLTRLLGGLLLLLPAVVLGFIVDEVLPTGEHGLLYAATAALAAFALIQALLHVLQGTALMRLDGHAVSRIEAAFWDRLLRLPPSFLHRYTTGDLAMRVLAFQNLRRDLQGVVANGVLSIVLLLLVCSFIFFYNAMLGGVIAAFGLLSLLATVVLGLGQISPHGRVSRTVQRLAGRLYQLINGIAKLRGSGAEGSAFALWARDYREQKLAELELGAFETHMQAFGAALPFLAGAVLILAATLQETITVRDFLVVYTAFMVFYASIVRLGASFSGVATIMPALDQIQPFLAESPKMSVEGRSVEKLGGEIVFDHVSFQYDPNGPLILDDVSIHARPGEFVAIAGKSGSGKSTLLRLALGLDQPLSGAVYYDGRDLRHLNIKQVRRQIGLVPQEVRLHPEDVWDNVVGDHEGVTVEDVREAVRLATVDREIAAMPMGMLTYVGASASVTSGGESQRITIAHALLGNPRILLLDEATNWLDNDTQSKIMINLAHLTSTRIVIAHRLSTLRRADRIYVMQDGKVVQEGSFTELVATEGVFQDLVRRQMA